MRSPAPRQWAALAIVAVALPALLATAWPLGLLLRDLLSAVQPWPRVLLGLLWVAALVVAGALARTRHSRAPLWLGWLILAAWAVATAAVAGMALSTWLVLGSPGLQLPDRLSARDLDAIATRAFAVVAGLGAVAALVISYRRQRLTENAEERENTKLFTERFTTAVSQLGDEQPAVRLGGVHALAHLADDAPRGPRERELRQMCIDVLCAYLRMPYKSAPEPLEADASSEEQAAYEERALAFAALQEVRHTIIRIIQDRLRQDTPWRGHDYDFTGVVFDRGNLSGVHFTGGRVDFNGARFTDQMAFTGAHFTGGVVVFAGARFTGDHVLFSGARFAGSEVFFSGARFAGGRVSFHQARFTGGEVDFRGAEFTGGEVDFEKTEFAGSRMDFRNARFEGSQVSFELARFTDGLVDFTNARFRGGSVDFTGSFFTGSEVLFKVSGFSGGRVSFQGADFPEGRVCFDCAVFDGGLVDFSRAAFSGSQVSFDTVRFTDGLVDFVGTQPEESEASGTCPHQLPQAAAAGTPGVVRLPSHWKQPEAS